MPSLIVLLPLASPSPPSEAELAYALVSDSGMLTRQGQAGIAHLPPASELIVQVPAQMLSWQQVDLPKPGRAIPSAKLRAVLGGLLEDQVLDDPSQLHFALPAQAPGGEKTWVAVCQKTWLAAWLQQLEAQGRLASRIVPQAEPSASLQLHISGSPETAQFIAASAQGVLCAPLSQLHVLLPDLPADAPVSAEPAVAAQAQHALGEERSIQVLQNTQYATRSLGSDWNLGQFDLSTAGRDRLVQQGLRRLRQFAFAPEWRAARLGFILLVVAQIVGLNLWAWQTRTALHAQQLQLQALVKKATGASYVSDQPVKQVQLKLSALRQGTGSLSAQDLEPMLALLAAGTPPAAAGTQLVYDGSSLQLKGPPLDAQKLQTLRSAAAAQGYRVRTFEQTLEISPEDSSGTSSTGSPSTTPNRSAAPATPPAAQPAAAISWQSPPHQAGSPREALA